MESYQLKPLPTVPALQLGAAFDIVAHVFTSFEQERPTSLEKIQESLTAYQPALLSQTTELLITAGILHTIKEKGQLMPSTPLEKAGHDRIIEAVFGSDFTDTQGGKDSSLALQAAGKAHLETPGT